MSKSLWLIPWALMLTSQGIMAQWAISPPFDNRQSLPDKFDADWQSIKPGDKLPDEKYHWLTAKLTIPDKIDDRSTTGQAVGMHINAGDGGEVYVARVLQCRFDNDHPALALLAEKAKPGATVDLAVQIYGKAQGGEHFGEARWVIIDAPRVSQSLSITVDPAKDGGLVPDGIIGLSQGGGLSDYEDGLNERLKQGGFKWFRMDNILTNVVKETEDAELTYDWSDFDRRVDFIHKMGAEPIFAVSYMPIPLDALNDGERHSAPRDYGLWEDLCYQAAKHSLDRGKRVPYWEVWNEANSGWIKPGLQDRGRDYFKKIYNEALGEEEKNEEVVRRFEAYCKLYRATARGVKRADPSAKVGGPCLASGPWENKENGACQHGRGFSRGLIKFCHLQKLPLDFVSWHEYFQSAETIARQADTFREAINEFPDIAKGVEHFMLTEWNEAWWADRPQDHEIGAAYCADGVIRAFLPKGIDRPCFFYVKQGDMGFRGDYSMIMGPENLPKPAYHMASIFNHLSGRWAAVAGGDDDVCGVAAWDADKSRLAIVLVNYRDRFAFRRHVAMQIKAMPSELAGGEYRVWTVDATHSNIFHDVGKWKLEVTDKGPLRNAGFTWKGTLQANSITLVELLGKSRN